MLLPFKVDYDYYRKPVATISLIVANVLAFMAIHVVDVEIVIELLCWPDRFAPWQWVTATFLHADVFHLGGNMLFLFVYGRYVEERLGPVRFVILYLALGIAASLIFIAAQIVSGSDIPALGASGAISGLMGVVLLAGGGAKVRALFLWYPLVRVYSIPAWAILGFWVIEQAFLGLIGTPGIAISAHLGGFAAGVAAAWLLKQASLQNTLWYLDPAESTTETRSERANARLWGSIADYHRSR